MIFAHLNNFFMGIYKTTLSGSYPSSCFTPDSSYITLVFREKIMSKKHIFFILILCSIVYPSNVLAVNTTATGDETSSDSLSSYNLNIANNISAFPSQCGLSITGDYGNNGTSPNNNWGIRTTYNTTPCSNASDIEKSRQEHEKKIEQIRKEKEIEITCINARAKAVQENKDPDKICPLMELQKNLSSSQKLK